MHKEINTFFIQPLKYIFLLFIVFVLYELINVDNKYINKPTVTFDLNNVRNPQIKKITRYLDNKFGQIYFNISKKKQEEFYNNNLTEYENLPSEITISAKKIKFTISLWKVINKVFVLVKLPSKEPIGKGSWIWIISNLLNINK